MLTLMKQKRHQWLKAAKIYYLQPGDDTGLSDQAWDSLARELYRNRRVFPDCKILNNPEYNGGSLFWVKAPQYQEALSQYIP